MTEPTPWLATALLLFTATGCADKSGADEAARPTCPPPPTVPAGDEDALTPGQSRALATAQAINRNAPCWWAALPDCPCLGERVPPGWFGAPAKQEYHPGATTCYRSPPVSPEKLRAAGLDPVKIQPGQQCCYDARGRLITGGAAAGTPDLFSPALPASRPGHEQIDVALFVELGWELYGLYWPPNRGEGCPENRLP